MLLFGCWFVQVGQEWKRLRSSRTAIRSQTPTGGRDRPQRNGSGWTPPFQHRYIHDKVHTPFMLCVHHHGIIGGLLLFGDEIIKWLLWVLVQWAWCQLYEMVGTDWTGFLIKRSLAKCNFSSAKQATAFFVCLVFIDRDVKKLINPADHMTPQVASYHKPSLCLENSSVCVWCFKKRACRGDLSARLRN